MAAAASARLAWAAQILDVGPEDRVLEIGCGHGVAVSLVGERLVGGHILSIDRSQTMVEAATRRNAEHVDAGRATVEETTLEGAQLAERSIDKAFAFHVVALWKRPAETLPIVRGALVPGGRLYVFNQLPGGGGIAAARSVADEIASVLSDHGFAKEGVITEEMEPAPVACLIARPV